MWLWIALSLAGCATVSIPPTDVVLNEDQVVDLIEHSDKWLGRTITVQIYPYDNGFSKSFVACFERCDAAYAEKAIFLVYTANDRFKSYRGDQPAIVRAVLSKICPDSMPACLHNRIFALNEIG